MLEDRFYMRQPQFGSYRTATVALVILNVLVFVVQSLLPGTLKGFSVEFFALSLWGLKHGYVWQLLTYQFMHAGLMHLVFNCWAIYIFGREVELALGRSRFLTMYFASGVLGGLVQALAGLLLGGASAAPVVGASAAAFGLAAAFAILFPDQVLLLFFILPLRARYVLWLSAILAVLGIVFPTSNVAHAAHLGGMLAGALFARYASHWEWSWPWATRGSARPPRRLVKVYSPHAGPWGHGKPAEEEDLPAAEFLAREVDPILDKISAHGIQSLTDRERRILETARKKIVRR
jgi:membrane associated rhomboid family serine protease